MELLPETIQQLALWSEIDRERRERAWKTVDQLNATLGRGTVRILSAGPKDAAWKLRAEHRARPDGPLNGSSFFEPSKLRKIPNTQT